jgi:FtsZ-binding cell division protein ZapB
MYPDLIVIKDETSVRLNLHEQFQKRAGSVLSQYRTNKGKRNWEKLDTKTMKFCIFDDQLASYQEVEEEVKYLKNDIEEWKETYTNLEEEKRKLVKQMNDTINCMADEIRTLKETNNQLENYIKCLEEQEGFAFKGKDISETKNKQQTLKTFMSRAETALWFAKAFGLELESMKVKEVKTGKSHVIETNTVLPQPLVQKSFYNLQNSFFPTKFPCHPNGGKNQENPGKFEANV